MTAVRKPAVSGQFYPDRAADLRRMIGSLAGPPTKKVKAKAVVAPHAGYVYSGAVAAAVYGSVEIPATCLILAPAHRPIRPVFALMDEGSWQTPLGAVPIDRPLAAGIRRLCPSVEVDPAAHAFEHSLEVQLPFLQHIRDDVSIVPLTVSPRASYAALAELGAAIAEAVSADGRSVLLVASTDMSHYLPAEEARTKDFRAIDRVLALDPRGLFDVVRDEEISMCGVLPTTAVLIASRALGAVRAELIRYATSGDVTGDDREVVGYAGMRVV
jgi:hypothetical protein